MLNEFDRPATPDEAFREQVANRGNDNPQACWILTDQDVWVRNPAYVGPEEPHPESEPVSATPTVTLKRVIIIDGKEYVINEMDFSISVGQAIGDGVIENTPEAIQNWVLEY